MSYRIENFAKIQNCCHMQLKRKNFFTKKLGNEGKRELVPWCHGAVVLWCYGVVVPWCCGAVVLWC